MFLEVCCDTIEAALTAAENGADRLELCTAIEVGGLTPTYGLIEEVDKFILQEKLSVRYRVLLRCRSGDFVYTESEIATMLRDLLNIQALNLKALEGFVIGALEPDGGPHIPQLRRMEQLLASELNFTFHRAIDVRPLHALQLVCTSFSRFDTVLTSGGTLKSIDGIATISQMIQLYGSKIKIMVGSGVNIETISLIRAALPKCQWFHASMPFSSVVTAPLGFGVKKNYNSQALQTLLGAIRSV